MKHLKKFNEGNDGVGSELFFDPDMKQFVLTTTSESSDHYMYFIEHPQMPTTEELKKFLIKHGSDVDEEDGISYEQVDECVEIKDFKRI